MKSHRIFATTLYVLMYSFLSLACLADAPLDDELSEAMALKGDATKGREIFSICAACHTTEAWGTKDGRYPHLAGQHSSVIIKQLADIRAGHRDNPEMYPLAKEDVLGAGRRLLRMWQPILIHYP
jgi:cytochrome c553